jgi:hypothetical protein
VPISLSAFHGSRPHPTVWFYPNAAIKYYIISEYHIHYDPVLHCGLASTSCLNKLQQANSLEDIFINDELFDVTFQIQEVDNIVYEVDCNVVDVDKVDADVGMY